MRLFGRGNRGSMEITEERESYCAEDTFALGEQMGKEAKPGQLFTLIGDLGVGKTVFTQGFAAGLGITEPVNSPTFTILQSLSLIHI